MKSCDVTTIYFSLSSFFVSSSMVKLFTIIFLLLCCFKLSAQSNNLPSSFDEKELKDSAFKELVILRYYYEYNYPAEHTDSVSVLKYDSLGRMIYKKDFMGGGDSLVFRNIYQLGNDYTSIKDQFFHGKRQSRGVKNFSSDGRVLSWGMLRGEVKEYPDEMNIYFYDENKKLIKESDGTQYYYDQRGRLERLKHYGDNSADSFIVYYYYNKKDSVQIQKMIEWQGDKKDSVFWYYSYDDKGRRTEEVRQPSKTYHETFNMDCSTGDFYCNKYAYDSLGRMIFEANLEHEVRGIELRYASEIFALYTYLPDGYIRQAYNSQVKPTWRTVYNTYETTIGGHRLKRESLNELTTVTTFLSEKSNLPQRIDHMSGKGLNETKIFVYKK